jgi:hypothetical protein
MKSRIPEWAVARFGRPKTVASVALLFVVSQACIGVILGPVVGRDLGLMQSFSLIQPSLFRELAAAWGPEERENFRRHFYLDFFIHPIIYSFFLLSWMTLEASQRQMMPLRYDTWSGLIFLAGACDVIENAIHFAMLPELQKAGDAEIRAAAVFSIIKWLIAGATFAWCAASLFARRGKMVVREKDA